MPHSLDPTNARLARPRHHVDFIVHDHLLAGSVPGAGTDHLSRVARLQDHHDLFYM
jgi:hypothetical protein